MPRLISSTVASVTQAKKPMLHPEDTSTPLPPPTTRLPYPFNLPEGLEDLDYSPSYGVTPDPDGLHFVVEEIQPPPDDDITVRQILQFFADGVHIFINSKPNTNTPEWTLQETVLVESIKSCVTSLDGAGISFDWHRGPQLKLQKTNYLTIDVKGLHEAFSNAIQTKIELRKLGVEMIIYKISNMNTRKVPLAEQNP